MNIKTEPFASEAQNIFSNNEINQVFIKNENIENDEAADIKENIMHQRMDQCLVQPKEEPVEAPVMIKYEIFMEDDDYMDVDIPNNAVVNTEERSISNVETATVTPAEVFDCTNCGASFLTRKKLNRHICEGIKNLTCPICSKILTSEKSLRTHIWKYHDKAQPFVCNGCSRTFVTLSSLQKHLKSNLDCRIETEANKTAVSEIVMQNICPICSTDCENEADLNDHVSNYHNIEKLYPCRGCGRYFSTQDIFDIHLTENAKCAFDNVSETKDYPKCALCNSSYTDFSKLADHMRERHGNLDLLACKSCDLRFMLRFQLNLHLKHSEICSNTKDKGKILLEAQQKVQTLNKIDNQYLKCDICYKLFKGPKSLNSHMNAEHKESLQFECSHCKMNFKSLNSFENHVMEVSQNCKDEEQLLIIAEYKNRNHTGPRDYTSISDDLRTCILCNKIFVNILALRSHMHSCHKDVKPFSCKTCGHKFAIRPTLRRHMQMEMNCNNSEEMVLLPEVLNDVEEREAAKKLSSNGVEYRTCTLCNKTYATLNALRCHMTTIHKGIKQYKCHNCEVKFVTKQGYHTHLKKTENCRKPEEDLNIRTCPICIKVFKTKGSLHIHWIRKHKGKFFYSCDTCKRTFKYQRELKTHLEHVKCFPPIEIKEENSLDIDEFGYEEDEN